VVSYLHLRTNMYKKILLLILTFFSGFMIWNYNNNNDFYLKNQNTIVNFLDHNQFNLDFKINLNDPVFKNWFDSHYTISGLGSIYYLNNNLAGNLSLGFDYLKYKQLNLSFLVDDSDLFFRITNNTFEDLAFSFLHINDWQRVSLDSLKINLSSLNYDNWITLKDDVNELVLMKLSNEFTSTYNLDWLSNIDLFIDSNHVFTKDNVLDLNVIALKFAGQLPISRPNTFQDFNQNLL